MAQVTQQCQDMTAEISVFSFRQNDNSDVAEVTSRGRVFQILGPAVANERSPTVTRRDGRTSYGVRHNSLAKNSCDHGRLGNQPLTGVNEMADYLT